MMGLLFQLALFLAFPLSTKAEQRLLPNKLNASIPAVFVFGDSTVDPGNNDYLTTPFKSNFPPYGRDFSQHKPTGRFTNGKLATDFIASDLGIKEEIPPYLDATLSLEELVTGVSFAFAGSGYDPLTADISEVMDITEQLNYFKEYLNRVEGLWGEKRATKLIEESVFVCSAGTNDFTINYYGLHIRSRSYSIQGYQNFILQRSLHLIQGLYELGAHKIVVVGLPPMGCIPAVITTNSQTGLFDRGCVTSLNHLAIDYNQKLQESLSSMQQSLVGSMLAYADIYHPLQNMILNPAKFGFEESKRGCCGTGLIEFSFTCNAKSVVCPDASRYVFWDAVHPTEKAYRVIADSLFSSMSRFLDL